MWCDISGLPSARELWELKVEDKFYYPHKNWHGDVRNFILTPLFAPKASSNDPLNLTPSYSFITVGHTL